MLEPVHHSVKRGLLARHARINSIRRLIKFDFLFSLQLRGRRPTRQSSAPEKSPRGLERRPIHGPRCGRRCPHGHGITIERERLRVMPNSSTRRPLSLRGSNWMRRRRARSTTIRIPVQERGTAAARSRSLIRLSSPCGRLACALARPARFFFALGWRLRTLLRFVPVPFANSPLFEQPQSPKNTCPRASRAQRPRTTGGPTHAVRPQLRPASSMPASPDARLAPDRNRQADDQLD